MTDNGFVLTDLEVRKGDSIRVFVEVTTPENGIDDPQLVEDDLVFTLESGVQQKVNLRAWAWDAETISNLTVTSDMTISPGKPIIVYGGITVGEGATLIIRGGTTLYFHSGAGITVNGTLKCYGSEGNFVTLRGDRLDRMFDNLPYDMVSGQWNGITIGETSWDNEILYTDVHSAMNGIVINDSTFSPYYKLTMTNSIVHNNQGYCLSSRNAAVTVLNCQITNALEDCVYIQGGHVTINNTTMAQFYRFDSERGVALRFSSKTDGPLYQLVVANSIVTGYADDQLMGDIDSIGGNYAFDHCILCTPEVSDSMLTNIIFESPDSAVAQEKNFVLIDEDNYICDFRLDSLSKAVNGANTATSSTIELTGRKRDELPDIGCYEFYK